jgi:hypothetical protein
MTQRVNPFATIDQIAAFTPKQPRPKPVANETIDRIAEENGFPSRQSPRAPREPKRKPRIYRTGRNRQLSIKATEATVERFYKLADARKIPLGALLEQALDALERAGESDRLNSATTR